MTPLLLEGRTCLAHPRSPGRESVIWIELAQNLLLLYCLAPALELAYPMALLCRHSYPSCLSCLDHDTAYKLRATIVLTKLHMIYKFRAVVWFHVFISESQSNGLLKAAGSQM